MRQEYGYLSFERSNHLVSEGEKEWIRREIEWRTNNLENMVLEIWNPNP